MPADKLPPIVGFGQLCMCLIPLSLVSCVSTGARGRADVATALTERTGSGPSPVSVADPLPPQSVDLGDGLSEREAVAIALWNNPQFEADLASLGFARAELAQAGMLQNPFLTLFFPLGPKQLEFTLNWALQDLWLRPRRVAVARLNAETIADSLIENGLDLAESVKAAYANVARLRKQAGLAAEMSVAERELAEIAEARFRAGDLSDLEASVVRTSSLTMEDEARRLALQATAAEQQLLSLLGLEPETLPPAFAMEENVTEPNLPADSPELVKTAWAARPDVRAAELAIESAGERLGLEKSSYWNITAILDANGQGLEGFEMGPGVSAWIPVFDRNQGGVSLAEAEMERAVRRYVAVRNRVANEVRDAHSKRVEMESSVRRWRSEIVPRLAETLERTERALDAGDVSFAEFLNARLSYLGGRRRLADLDYDLSAASARLENAVGRSLEDAQ